LIEYYTAAFVPFACKFRQPTDTFCTADLSEYSDLQFLKLRAIAISAFGNSEPSEWFILAKPLPPANVEFVYEPPNLKLTWGYPENIRVNVLNTATSTFETHSCITNSSLQSCTIDI
jgi:hypothetical protein